MTLHTNIKNQIKEAMIAKDTVKLGVVRGLVTAFMNELVATKRTPQDELTDEEALNVIRRAVKQRKDSIDQFTTGGRPELAESEKAELSVLEEYLPAMMSLEEVEAFAKAKITQMGMGQIGSTGSPQAKAGQFMGTLMKELKGKADGDVVKAVVDKLLS
jgi:uncharacterized protein YqeY